MFSGKKEQLQPEESAFSGRIKTVEAYISGRVQGVGFRACVKRIACSLRITGRVMNLDDGRVHLIATGESVIIDKMISSLYECPRAYIREMDIKEIKHKEFGNFDIERGD
nr:acylphosphatase [Methanomicrobium sp. W14]